MKKLITMAIILLYLVVNASAQNKSEAEVKNVDFELKNNKIEIIYDIVNFADEETFDISVEILNSEDEPIEAKSLQGDIDKNISGGFNKKIIWDLMKDKVIISDSIFIKITAKLHKDKIKEERE